MQNSHCRIWLQRISELKGSFFAKPSFFRVHVSFLDSNNTIHYLDCKKHISVNVKSWIFWDWGLSGISRKYILLGTNISPTSQHFYDDCVEICWFPGGTIYWLLNGEVGRNMFSSPPDPWDFRPLPCATNTRSSHVLVLYIRPFQSIEHPVCFQIKLLLSQDYLSKLGTQSITCMQILFWVYGQVGAWVFQEFLPSGFRRYSGMWKGPPPGHLHLPTCARV